jgi:Helix-turn-helix domain
MQVEVPDALLDALADRLASKVADRLAIPRLPSASPWMTFEELATYTKIAKGTLRKLGAEGTFKAHGGKRKLYHREEVDAALLGLSHVPRLSRPIVLRRAS